jgi:hypothetical protein
LRLHEIELKVPGERWLLAGNGAGDLSRYSLPPRLNSRVSDSILICYERAMPDCA